MTKTCPDCHATVLSTSQPERADVPEALTKALNAFSDFINEPPQYEDKRMVRDYRHELARKWIPVFEAIHATVLSTSQPERATPERVALEEAVRLFEGYGLIAGRTEADPLAAGRWINNARAALAATPAVDLAWRSGAPSKPWSSEWFIAVTTFGDRVVLTELPDEWTYDFKTADDTYFKKDKILRWMQFPDSEFIAPATPAVGEEPVAWRYKCKDGSEVLMLKRLTDEQKRRGYYTGEDGEDEVDDDEAIVGPFYWAEETPLYAAPPAFKAAVGGEAPDWLWYGEDANGKPVVTFGRWPKNGAKWRYKLAEIQPTEHDHPEKELPKRPFAFAVLRAPENGPDQWRLFMDEGEAREAAEQLDGDYEGLYRVGDRRSALYSAPPVSPLRGRKDEALNVVQQMVAAYDSGNLQMSSPEIGEPENNIPMHQWHEELLYYARAAIAPPPEQPAVAVDISGWKLVPDDPTEEMWQAGRSADEAPGDSYSKVWRAMFSAAPNVDDCETTSTIAAQPASPLRGITDEMVNMACEVYAEIYHDDDKDMGDAMRAALKAVSASPPERSAAECNCLMCLAEGDNSPHRIRKEINDG